MAKASTESWSVEPASLVNGTRVGLKTTKGTDRPTKRSEVPTDLRCVVDPEFIGICTEDVPAVVDAADEGLMVLMSMPEHERTELLARWVNAAADVQEARISEIAAVAAREVCLPEATRLTKLEGPRAYNQLRLIATAAREGSWRDRRIAPGSDSLFDTRSQRIPWGVTVNFGPDTFPLAFPGVNGAMTAGAIMAGNANIPVSAWNTLATNSLLHECWLEAADGLDLHPGLTQFVHVFDIETAKALVSHQRVKLTGFTGGEGFGTLLANAAGEVGNLLLGEYGGPNSIFIGRSALADQPKALGEAFAGPCTTMGQTGLFCNSAKLGVRLAGNGDNTFDCAVKDGFASKLTADLCLVSSSTRDNYNAAVQSWVATFGEPAASSDGEPDPNTCQVKAHVFFIDGADALANWDLIVSAPFGPCAARILASDLQQMEEIAERCAALACARWYLDADKAEMQRVFIRTELATGRTVGKLGGTTAGIRWDTDAVIHTGPHPASNAAWFSTVGPVNVLTAFSRPHCYQDFPLEDYPRALQGG